MPVKLDFGQEIRKSNEEQCAGGNRKGGSYQLNSQTCGNVLSTGATAGDFSQITGYAIACPAS